MLIITHFGNVAFLRNHGAICTRKKAAALYIRRQLDYLFECGLHTEDKMCSYKSSLISNSVCDQYLAIVLLVIAIAELRECKKNKHLRSASSRFKYI